MVGKYKLYGGFLSFIFFLPPFPPKTLFYHWPIIFLKRAGRKYCPTMPNKVWLFLFIAIIFICAYLEKKTSFFSPFNNILAYFFMEFNQNHLKEKWEKVVYLEYMIDFWTFLFSLNFFVWLSWAMSRLLRFFLFLWMLYWNMQFLFFG